MSFPRCDRPPFIIYRSHFDHHLGQLNECQLGSFCYLLAALSTESRPRYGQLKRRRSIQLESNEAMSVCEGIRGDRVEANRRLNEVLVSSHHSTVRRSSVSSSLMTNFRSPLSHLYRFLFAAFFYALIHVNFFISDEFRVESRWAARADFWCWLFIAIVISVESLPLITDQLDHNQIFPHRPRPAKKPNGRAMCRWTTLRRVRNVVQACSLSHRNAWEREGRKS